MTASLAFDAAVASRDRLLDCAGMRESFATHLGVGSQTLEAIRVKYRPGVDLRVAYRATAADEPVIVTMRTGSGRLRAGRDGGVVVPELDATFWRFPHDRRLPGLPDLLSPPPDLAAHAGGWVRSRIAGYAPEKSVVVACLDADAAVVAYAKLYAPDEEGSGAFARHAAIASSAAAAGLRVPGPIAFDAARHVALTAAMPGVRLADVPAASQIRAVRSLGGAIATLHGLPIAARVLGGTRDVPRQLVTAVALLGRVRPALRRRATALTSQLIARGPRPVAPSLLHGDVHLKNAIVDGGSLSLVDLDQARSGPAAEDIGSFLGWIRAQVACDVMPVGHATALAGAFLDGYAALAPLPGDATLRWHTAASMLAERTVRAVTRMRTAMLPHLDRILDSARHVLEEDLP